MQTLRAFVSEEADLYKYWLYKNSEGNIQYQKAIGTALSLSDDGYHSMCICTFEDNKIVNIDDMFVGTEDRNIHDQRNTSFRELYDLDDAGANHYPRNLYNQYVPFMVPMILGSNIYKGSFNTPEVKVYSSPLKIQYLKVGKFFGTQMIDGEVKNLLGGTLAYTYNIDTKKVIYPSIYYNTDFEHYLLTRNVKDVLACLTQLFYLDSTESSVTRWVPDNYASLKDNYMVYKKDIVVELKPDYKSKKVKEFINLCGIKYQSYINEVIKKSKAVSIDIAMENVNLILKGCQITTPIEFHIDYKQPNIDASYITDNVKVESIFHDFNTTNLNIVPNTIYAYNNSTKQFENVKGVGNLISVPIDIDIENKIYLKDLEYKTDITKFNTLLMKDDENRLGIESNILSKGSYTIHTCNLLNYSVYYGFEGTPKVDIFNCINNVY